MLTLLLTLLASSFLAAFLYILLDGSEWQEESVADHLLGLAISVAALPAFWLMGAGWRVARTVQRIAQ